MATPARAVRRTLRRCKFRRISGATCVRLFLRSNAAGLPTPGFVVASALGLLCSCGNPGARSGFVFAGREQEGQEASYWLRRRARGPCVEETAPLGRLTCRSPERCCRRANASGFAAPVAVVPAICLEASSSQPGPGPGRSLSQALLDPSTTLKDGFEVCVKHVSWLWVCRADVRLGRSAVAHQQGQDNFVESRHLVLMYTGIRLSLATQDSGEARAARASRWQRASSVAERRDCLVLDKVEKKGWEGVFRCVRGVCSASSAILMVFRSSACFFTQCCLAWQRRH
jgi:hypothetical protein